MSRTKIDEYIWAVEAQLRRKHGISQAERYMIPLVWYINTARASAQFLRLLLDTKPSTISRVLEAGGSDEDVINRICSKLNYTRS